MGRCLLIVLFFISCNNTTSQTVVKVHDGDTFYTDSGEKIRLAEIDAPELTQAFGLEAKRFLDSIVLNKVVKLVKTGNDKYGRSICEVYIGNVWVNKAIVDAGYAWAYKRYSSLNSNQIKARNAHKGLWKEYALPPFKYR